MNSFENFNTQKPAGAFERSAPAQNMNTGLPPQQSQSAEALLLKLLADEQEKKRRQQEQERALFQLLRQVLMFCIDLNIAKLCVIVKDCKIIL